jgi:hypothetical protein
VYARKRVATAAAWAERTRRDIAASPLLQRDLLVFWPPQQTKYTSKGLRVRRLAAA